MRILQFQTLKWIAKIWYGENVVYKYLDRIFIEKIEKQC